MPITRIEKFSCGTVWKQTREVIGDRREERSEEKRSQKTREVRREVGREDKLEVKKRLELEMSDDGEGSGGHEADFVDMTEDMEIELHLPRNRIDLVRTSKNLRGPTPRVRLLSARRNNI